MPAVSLTVNGKAVNATVEPRTLLVQLLRGNLRLTGTHVGCDTTQCGCLRRPCGRQGGQILHHAGDAGGRRRRHDHRGPGDGGRHAASDAGGVPRESRAAMRLLYARHGHDGGRHGQPARPLDSTSRPSARGSRAISAAAPATTTSSKAIAAGAKAMGERRARATGGRIEAAKTSDRTTRGGRRLMSATGIGAAVRRKEDFRFLTGKGQYTDDINRPARAAIYFLRSPHAHARIKAIDTAAAAGMPGVLAVFTGADIAADKIGSLICGWMIHSKDGSPMKMAPHPAHRERQGVLRRRPVAVVDRRDVEAARGRRREGRGRLRGAAGGRRSGEGAAQGAPQIHEIAPAQHDLRLAARRCRRRSMQAFKSAAHVTKLEIINNRLVPNAMEPRAAIGDYDAGTATSRCGPPPRIPHVARLLIWAFVGIAPEHKLRVIAPDVGGGFGSKIFIYPEEVVACGRRKRSAARSSGWRSARKPSWPTPMAATTSPRPRWRSTATARSRRCGSRPSPISAPICRPSRPRCRPISTRRCWPASTPSRRSTARSRRSSPTPCRSTPIAAPGGRKRPSCSSAWSRSARASSGSTPAEMRRKNFIDNVPVPDAGHHALRHRRLRRLARRRRWSSPTSRTSPSASANRAPRQAARHRHVRPISRPAASRRARRSARSAAASACGNPPRCGSIRPAASRCSPARTATARATRRPSRSSSPDRLGIPIENVEVVHGDTDKVPFGMGTYGSRSGAVGMSAIVKALDKIEAKAKKVAAHLMEAAEADIEFKDGQFTVAGTDKSAAWGDVSLARLYRPQLPGRSSSPASRRPRSTTRRTSPSRPAAISARSRSIPTPASPDRPVGRGRRFRRRSSTR